MKSKIHVLGVALSRIPHTEAPTTFAINVMTREETSFEAPSHFKSMYRNDTTFGPIYRALDGTTSRCEVQREHIARLLPLFKLNDRFLLYDSKICVPRRNVKEILKIAHDNKLSGHFSFIKTLSRLNGFHWKHKTKDVEDYCAGCKICQCRKDSRKKPLGVPEPLEAPQRRWGSISINFITQVPVTTSGYDSITTFVDRFSKRIHLVASKTTDTALDLANCFFDNTIRLHGLPYSIASDRDPKFTAKFWQELMRKCGIKLEVSTSKHPQTDGSAEVMNRVVENYLRYYCAHHQRDRDQLLSSAEFAYNSATIETMKCSPF